MKRISLTIDVFEHREQQAEALENLSVRELIRALLQEFAADVPYLDQRDPDKYVLRRPDSDTPLVPKQKLREIEEIDAAHLRLEEKAPPPDERGERQEMPGRVYLRITDESGAEQVCRLFWQPALIGRSDPNYEGEHLLAVNLEQMTGSHRVSRRHAQVTARDGRYYIAPLLPAAVAGSRPVNPVLLNGEVLVGEGEIRPGDSLRLEWSGIEMRLILP